MVSRLSSLGAQWMKTPAVMVLIIYLNVCGVDCTVAPSTTGGTGCSHGSVASMGSRDPCSRQYQRCEEGEWRRAMCVGGIINNETGECVPYNQDCPDPGVTERTFTSRSKRQASAGNNCHRSYMCPTDLERVFIYPDWTNKNCDSYIVCASPKLLVASCKTDGYLYYNPGRLSCEEIASPTNMCVHRLNTVLAS